MFVFVIAPYIISNLKTINWIAKAWHWCYANLIETDIESIFFSFVGVILAKLIVTLTLSSNFGKVIVQTWSLFFLSSFALMIYFFLCINNFILERFKQTTCDEEILSNWLWNDTFSIMTEEIKKKVNLNEDWGVSVI